MSNHVPSNPDSFLADNLPAQPNPHSSEAQFFDYRDNKTGKKATFSFTAKFISKAKKSIESKESGPELPEILHLQMKAFTDAAMYSTYQAETGLRDHAFIRIEDLDELSSPNFEETNIQSSPDLKFKKYITKLKQEQPAAVRQLETLLSLLPGNRRFLLSKALQLIIKGALTGETVKSLLEGRTQEHRLGGISSKEPGVPALVAPWSTTEVIPGFIEALIESCYPEDFVEILAAFKQKKDFKSDNFVFKYEDFEKLNRNIPSLQDVFGKLIDAIKFFQFEEVKENLREYFADVPHLKQWGEDAELSVSKTKKNANLTALTNSRQSRSDDLAKLEVPALKYHDSRNRPSAELTKILIERNAKDPDELRKSIIDSFINQITLCAFSNKPLTEFLDDYFLIMISPRWENEIQLLRKEAKQRYSRSDNWYLEQAKSKRKDLKDKDDSECREILEKEYFDQRVKSFCLGDSPEAFFKELKKQSAYSYSILSYADYISTVDLATELYKLAKSSIRFDKILINETSSFSKKKAETHVYHYHVDNEDPKSIVANQFTNQSAFLARSISLRTLSKPHRVQKGLMLSLESIFTNDEISHVFGPISTTSTGHLTAKTIYGQMNFVADMLLSADPTTPSYIIPSQRIDRWSDNSPPPRTHYASQAQQVATILKKSAAISEAFYEASATTVTQQQKRQAINTLSNALSLNSHLDAFVLPITIGEGKDLVTHLLVFQKVQERVFLKHINLQAPLLNDAKFLPVRVYDVTKWIRQDRHKLVAQLMNLQPLAAAKFATDHTKKGPDFLDSTLDGLLTSTPGIEYCARRSWAQIRPTSEPLPRKGSRDPIKALYLALQELTIEDQNRLVNNALELKAEGNLEEATVQLTDNKLEFILDSKVSFYRHYVDSLVEFVEKNEDKLTLQQQTKVYEGLLWYAKKLKHYMEKDPLVGLELANRQTSSLEDAIHQRLLKLRDIEAKEKQDLANLDQPVLQFRTKMAQPLDKVLREEVIAVRTPQSGNVPLDDINKVYQLQDRFITDQSFEDSQASLGIFKDLLIDLDRLLAEGKLLEAKTVAAAVFKAIPTSQSQDPLSPSYWDRMALTQQITDDLTTTVEKLKNLQFGLPDVESSLQRHQYLLKKNIERQYEVLKLTFEEQNILLPDLVLEQDMLESQCHDLMTRIGHIKVSILGTRIQNESNPQIIEDLKEAQRIVAIEIQELRALLVMDKAALDLEKAINRRESEQTIGKLRTTLNSRKETVASLRKKLNGRVANQKVIPDQEVDQLKAELALLLTTLRTQADALIQWNEALTDLSERMWEAASRSGLIPLPPREAFEFNVVVPLIQRKLFAQRYAFFNLENDMRLTTYNDSPEVIDKLLLKQTSEIEHRRTVIRAKIQTKLNEKWSLQDKQDQELETAYIIKHEDYVRKLQNYNLDQQNRSNPTYLRNNPYPLDKPIAPVKPQIRTKAEKDRERKIELTQELKRAEGMDELLSILTKIDVTELKPVADHVLDLNHRSHETHRLLGAFYKTLDIDKRVLGYRLFGPEAMKLTLPENDDAWTMTGDLSLLAGSSSEFDMRLRICREEAHGLPAPKTLGRELDFVYSALAGYDEFLDRAFPPTSTAEKGYQYLIKVKYRGASQHDVDSLSFLVPYEFCLIRKTHECRKLLDHLESTVLRATMTVGKAGGWERPLQVFVDNALRLFNSKVDPSTALYTFKQASRMFLSPTYAEGGTFVISSEKNKTSGSYSVGPMEHWTMPLTTTDKRAIYLGQIPRELALSGVGDDEERSILINIKKHPTIPSTKPKVPNEVGSNKDANLELSLRSTLAMVNSRDPERPFHFWSVLESISFLYHYLLQTKKPILLQTIVDHIFQPNLIRQALEEKVESFKQQGPALQQMYSSLVGLSLPEGAALISEISGAILDHAKDLNKSQKISDQDLQELEEKLPAYTEASVMTLFEAHSNDIYQKAIAFHALRYFSKHPPLPSNRPAWKTFFTALTIYNESDAENAHAGLEAEVMQDIRANVIPQLLNYFNENPQVIANYLNNFALDSDEMTGSWVRDPKNIYRYSLQQEGKIIHRIDLSTGLGAFRELSNSTHKSMPQSVRDHEDFQFLFRSSSPFAKSEIVNQQTGTVKYSWKVESTGMQAELLYEPTANTIQIFQVCKGIRYRFHRIELDSEMLQIIKGKQNKTIESLILYKGIWVQVDKDGNQIPSAVFVPQKGFTLEDPIQLEIVGEKIIAAYVGSDENRKVVCSGFSTTFGFLDVDAPFWRCRHIGNLLLLSKDGSRLDEIRFPGALKKAKNATVADVTWELIIVRNAQNEWVIAEKEHWKLRLKETAEIERRFGPDWREFVLPFACTNVNGQTEYMFYVYPYSVVTSGKHGDPLIFLKTMEDFRSHYGVGEDVAMGANHLSALTGLAESLVPIVWDLTNPLPGTGAFKKYMAKASKLAKIDIESVEGVLNDLTTAGIDQKLIVPKPLLVHFGSEGASGSHAAFLYLAEIAAKQGRMGAAIQLLGYLDRARTTEEEREQLQALIFKTYLLPLIAGFASNFQGLKDIIEGPNGLTQEGIAKLIPLLNFPKSPRNIAFVIKALLAIEKMRPLVDGVSPSSGMPIQPFEFMGMPLKDILVILLAGAKAMYEKFSSKELEDLAALGLQLEPEELELFASLLPSAQIKGVPVGIITYTVVSKLQPAEIKNMPVQPIRLNPPTKEELEAFLTALVNNNNPDTSRTVAQIMNAYGRYPKRETVISNFLTFVESILHEDISEEELSYLFKDISPKETLKEEIDTARKLLLMLFYMKKKYSEDTANDFALDLLEKCQQLRRAIPDFADINESSERYEKAAKEYVPKGIFGRFIKAGKASWSLGYNYGVTAAVKAVAKKTTSHKHAGRTVVSSNSEELMKLLGYFIQRLIPEDLHRGVYDISAYCPTPADLPPISQTDDPRPPRAQKVIAPPAKHWISNDEKLKEAKTAQFAEFAEKIGAISPDHRQYLQQHHKELLSLFLLMDLSKGDFNLAFESAVSILMEDTTGNFLHRFSTKNFYYNYHPQLIPFWKLAQNPSLRLDELSLHIPPVEKGSWIQEVPLTAGESTTWVNNYFQTIDNETNWKEKLEDAKKLAAMFRNKKDPREIAANARLAAGIDKIAKELQAKSNRSLKVDQISNLKKRLQTHLEKIAEEADLARRELLAFVSDYQTPLFLAPLLADPTNSENQIIEIVIDYVSEGKLQRVVGANMRKELVTKVTHFMLVMTEKQQLQRAQADLEALSDEYELLLGTIDPNEPIDAHPQEYIDHLQELANHSPGWLILCHDFLTRIREGSNRLRYATPKGHLRDPQFTLKYLAMEYKRSWIARPKAIEAIEQMCGVNGHALKHFVKVRMGIGKSTFVFRVLTRLMLERGFMPVVMTTDQLLPQLISFLDNRSYIFKFDIKYGLAARDTTMAEGQKEGQGIPNNEVIAHLDHLEEALFSLKAREGYVVTTPSSRAALRNKRVALQDELKGMEEGKNRAEKFIILEKLKKIESFFRAKDIRYLEDEDITRSISLEYNLATTASRRTNAIRYNMAEKFSYEMLKDDSLRPRLMGNSIRGLVTEDKLQALKKILSCIYEDTEFWTSVGWNEQSWRLINKEQFIEYCLGTRSSPPAGMPNWDTNKLADLQEHLSYVAALKTLVSRTFDSVHSTDARRERGIDKSGCKVIPFSDFEEKKVSAEGAGQMEFGEEYETILHAQFHAINEGNETTVTNEALFTRKAKILANSQTLLSQFAKSKPSSSFKEELPENSSSWKFWNEPVTGAKWYRRISDVSKQYAITPFQAFCGLIPERQWSKRDKAMMALCRLQFFRYIMQHTDGANLHSEQYVCNSQETTLGCETFLASGTGDEGSLNLSTKDGSEDPDDVFGETILCLYGLQNWKGGLDVKVEIFTNPQDHILELALVPENKAIVTGGYDVFGGKTEKIAANIRNTLREKHEASLKAKSKGNLVSERQLIYCDTKRAKKIWNPGANSTPEAYDSSSIKPELSPLSIYGAADSRGMDFAIPIARKKGEVSRIHVMVDLNDRLSDVLQMLWRARHLGHGHEAILSIDEKMAVKVRSMIGLAPDAKVTLRDLFKALQLMTLEEEELEHTKAVSFEIRKPKKLEIDSVLVTPYKLEKINSTTVLEEFEGLLFSAHRGLYVVMAHINWAHDFLPKRTIGDPLVFCTEYYFNELKNLKFVERNFEDAATAFIMKKMPEAVNFYNILLNPNEIDPAKRTQSKREFEAELKRHLTSLPSNQAPLVEQVIRKMQGMRIAYEQTRATLRKELLEHHFAFFLKEAFSKNGNLKNEPDEKVIAHLKIQFKDQLMQLNKQLTALKNTQSAEYQKQLVQIKEDLQADATSTPQDATSTPQNDKKQAAAIKERLDEVQEKIKLSLLALSKFVGLTEEEAKKALQTAKSLITRIDNNLPRDIDRAFFENTATQQSQEVEQHCENETVQNKINNKNYMPNLENPTQCAALELREFLQVTRADHASDKRSLVPMFSSLSGAIPDPLKLAFDSLFISRRASDLIRIGGRGVPSVHLLIRELHGKFITCIVTKDDCAQSLCDQLTQEKQNGTNTIGLYPLSSKYLNTIYSAHIKNRNKQKYDVDPDFLKDIIGQQNRGIFTDRAALDQGRHLPNDKDPGFSKAVVMAYLALNWSVYTTAELAALKEWIQEFWTGDVTVSDEIIKFFENSHCPTSAEIIHRVILHIEEEKKASATSKGSAGKQEQT